MTDVTTDRGQADVELSAWPCHSEVAPPSSLIWLHLEGWRGESSPLIWLHPETRDWRRAGLVAGHVVCPGG